MGLSDISVREGHICKRAKMIRFKTGMMTFYDWAIAIDEQI